MDESTDLVQLAALLSEAKTREQAAKAARIICEDAIVRATQFTKSEGQETFDQNNETGECQVILKQPITTKVDGDAWVALRRRLAPKHPARKVFKASYSLDTKAARELEANDKEAWTEISSVITRKPGKVSVEVKKVVILDPLAIDATKKLGTLGGS